MRAFIPNECICPFTSLLDALNEFSKEKKERKNNTNVSKKIETGKEKTKLRKKERKLKQAKNRRN